MFTHFPTLVVDLISHFLNLNDLYHLALTCSDTAFLVNNIANSPSLRAQWKRSFEMIKDLKQNDISPHKIMDVCFYDLLPEPKGFYRIRLQILGVELYWVERDNHFYFCIQSYGHQTNRKTIKIVSDQSFLVVSSNDTHNIYFISSNLKNMLRFRIHNLLVKKDVNNFIEIISGHHFFTGSTLCHSYGTRMKGIEFNFMGNCLVWKNGNNQSFRCSQDLIFNFSFCQNCFRYILLQTQDHIFVFDFKKLKSIPINQFQSNVRLMNNSTLFYYCKQMKTFYTIINRSVLQLRLIQSSKGDYLTCESIGKEDLDFVYCPFERKCEKLYKIKKMQ